MIGQHSFDAALDGIQASMQAAMPLRIVQRSLVLDPLNADQDALARGVVCLVNGGGGQFANYRGREGQLGHAALGVVAFVRVPEGSAPVDVEAAELAVLADVLAWVKAPGLPRPFDSALPKSFRQSRQLDFPWGWIVIELDVRP
ncbi:hypothetical protein KW843_07445 [Acidovorax sp. sif1233]|uniref:hypothetical protein n=1 Tax=Acidovorax sp. sif1233 TaxID=2854792 RepID=UPI001C4881BD|nr:hypothetical protein [Acidovorax sp. sif1233]MBV7454300.1 hypothetical protein [Acidovorax sp. sif1233]